MSAKRKTLAEMAAERLNHSAPAGPIDVRAEYERVLRDPRATPGQRLEATRRIHRLDGVTEETEPEAEETPALTPEEREAAIAEILARIKASAKSGYNGPKPVQRLSREWRTTEVATRVSREPEESPGSTTRTTGATPEDGPASGVDQKPARVIRWPVPAGTDPWTGFVQEREEFLSGTVAAGPTRYREVVRP